MTRGALRAASRMGTMLWASPSLLALETRVAPRFLQVVALGAFFFFGGLLGGHDALAQVANHTSIDDRDPLPLAFPLTLGSGDIYFGWQNELHWDTSSITLSNGGRQSRSPSDGQNTYALGFKPIDLLAFYFQATFPYREQSFQWHGQAKLWTSDATFPLDVDLGLGLGYSVKGFLLPDGQFLFSHIFRPAPRRLKTGQIVPGTGVVFAPQLGLGVRVLGQAFSSAAIDGNPNSPYAGATQRRLVFDATLAIEAEWKGFVGRLGTGWENLLQTYNTREDTPGAAFNVQNGPILFGTLGASFNIDNI